MNSLWGKRKNIKTKIPKIYIFTFLKTESTLLIFVERFKILVFCF